MTSHAYVLALAANALAAWDAKDDATFEVCKKLLVKIDAQKTRVADLQASCFPAKGQSMAHSRGDSLTIETTALATLAMIRSGQFTQSVNECLAYLVKTRNGSGDWGSTQATILALEALLAGDSRPPIKGEVPFVLKVDGKRVEAGSVTEKNADVLQVFDLTSRLKSGKNEVTIEVDAKTGLLYQIVGRHFEPHKKQVAPATKPILEVSMDYDRTKLTTADLLKATATMKYNGKNPTYMVMVNLPIPPGFTVDAGEFADMVAAKKVQKFAVTGREVILYIGDVKSGAEEKFTYALRPKYPIKVKTPPAVVYEYNTPKHRAATQPVELVVGEKK